MAILATKSDSVVSTSSDVPRTQWQRSLRCAVRNPVELCRLLSLPPQFEKAAIAASQLFPVFAPLEYIDRMQAGDPDDPLLRQVLPLKDELRQVRGFQHDAVDDGGATLVPGLLQKYQSRVLLVTTGACPVHCRYCFRRHFPYDQVPKSHEAWQPAIERIQQDDSIDEVILSGGDPLTLVDERLSQLADRLARIEHLRRLRIHTRFPIMIPSRVSSELLDWLVGTRLTPIVVVHANHANEIDEAVASAIGRLVDAGIVVMNQSVLLRRVNDHVDTLIQLSRRLVDLRVIPYYLHQLDRVSGTSHFEVPEETGRRLVHQMQRQLPGYAMPRYVREEAGADSKSEIV